MDKFQGNCFAPYSLRTLAIEPRTDLILWFDLGELALPRTGWMWDLSMGVVALKGAATDGCLISDFEDSLGLYDEPSLFSFLKDLIESICLLIPKY